MSCKTVNEAIKVVLKGEHKGLSSHDIYKKISEHGLYEFKSVTPHHIVLTQLRRHCVGLIFKSSNKDKYYKVDSDKKYSLT